MSLTLHSNPNAEHDLTWYNPDAFARALMTTSNITQEDANSKAWEYGRKKLVDSIEHKANYAFETTLGGNTITSLLLEATKTHQVIIWFCGLSSVEQHINRVKYRVSNGGHPIPEQKIYDRWISARINLIKLIPFVQQLQVFDNSVDVAHNEPIPAPKLVLEMKETKIKFPDLNAKNSLITIPEWAKPIVQAALELN
jgi:predicted ABC-type ATPase